MKPVSTHPGRSVPGSLQLGNPITGEFIVDWQLPYPCGHLAGTTAMASAPKVPASFYERQDTGGDRAPGTDPVTDAAETPPGSSRRA